MLVHYAVHGPLRTGPKGPCYVSRSRHCVPSHTTKIKHNGYLTQKSLDKIRYQLQKRGKLCQKKKSTVSQTQ